MLLYRAVRGIRLTLRLPDETTDEPAADAGVAQDADAAEEAGAALDDDAASDDHVVLDGDAVLDDAVVPDGGRGRGPGRCCGPGRGPSGGPGREAAEPTPERSAVKESVAGPPGRR